MFDDVAGLYGNPVILTYFRFDGAAPDGTVRPGADLTAMVRFDPVGAGCNDATGYCDPGAEIDWYINEVYQTTSTWTGYNGSLGGYIATFHTIAPQTPGYYSINAHRSNDIMFPFTVSAVDTDAGTVTNHLVSCEASTNPPAGQPCPCDGTELLLGYSVTVTKVGNGMAYLHVVIDGVEKYLFTTTTYDPDHGGIMAIPCLPSGTHSITIRGDDEPGTTVSMNIGSGDTTCYYYPCTAGCPESTVCGLCGNPPCSSVCVTNPCDNSCSPKPCTQCPSQTLCTTSPISIWDQIIAFINEQPVVALGGAAVLAYLLVKR